MKAWMVNRSRSRDEMEACLSQGRATFPVYFATQTSQTNSMVLDEASLPGSVRFSNQNEAKAPLTLIIVWQRGRNTTTFGQGGGVIAMACKAPDAPNQLTEGSAFDQFSLM